MGAAGIDRLLPSTPSYVRPPTAVRKIVEATFDKQTRVLYLVIPRAPRPWLARGGEPLRGCWVRRTIKIPRVARDSQSGRWKRITLPLG